MPRAYVLVLAAAALCYAALGAVLRILPAHVGDLGGSAAAVGLTVGAPALTAIGARPVAGRWADRRGPRPIVVGGAALMGAGIVPALGDASLAGLDASRLLVGAGEGAMMAAAVLWLLRLAGPERRGRALGHIGLANYAGLAAGPLLAEALGTDAQRVLVAAIVLPLAAAGLALVNVGYVAVIAFGATVAGAHGAAAAGAVVPVFAATVIAARPIGAGLPDRLGPGRTLRACVVAEGVGLAALAAAHGSVPAMAATAVLAAGQALAVPALGLLALAPVEPARHGAAVGLFFSFFDAGVGLGGPLVGVVARALSPADALAFAGAAVLAVWPAVATRRRLARLPGRPGSVYTAAVGQ